MRLNEQETKKTEETFPTWIPGRKSYLQTSTLGLSLLEPDQPGTRLTKKHLTHFSGSHLGIKSWDLSHGFNSSASLYTLRL